MKTPNFLAYLPASPAGGPSKKFILIVLIGAFFTVAGFFIFQQKNPANPPVAAEPDLSPKEAITVEEIDKDSDKDGLKDWEEALWKTDPNNPDTDGDGALDSFEIKENRNPLVAGNGKTDKLDTSQKGESLIDNSQISSAQSRQPSSLTEIIGQEIISDYLAVKNQKNGAALTDQEKNDFISSFSNQLENSSLLKTALPNTILYEKTDIKIADDNNSASIKEYGNNLAITLKRYFDPLTETPSAILCKALNNQDSNELKKLDSLINAYRNSAKEISKLTVPPSFADKHLGLINDLVDIAEELKNMTAIFDDPIAGYAAWLAYKKDVGSGKTILQSINKYFSENQIVFNAGEAGEYFKNYQ